MNREEFTRAVAQALADLFDFVQLEHNALCGAIPGEILGGLASPGRVLQREVLRGIEELKPASDISPAAIQWRTYHLLRLRYVEGMMVKEIMNHLQLGDRQLRRENQRAVAALAGLLWERWLGPEHAARSAASDPGAPPPAHQQFAATPALVDLADALGSVLHTLESLSEANRQRVTLRLPADLPPVQTDRVLLRQALITGLHHYLSRYPGERVTVEGEAAAGEPRGQRGGRLRGRLRLTICAPGGVAGWAEEELGKLQALFLQVNNRLEVEEDRVTLEMPLADARKLLIIDDDEAAIHLYRRYLTGLPYTILTVQDGREALQAAERLLPDLILLDVLLPNVDGWEILQQLKASPVVGAVPVIVCSAWNEPEIARSLGAELFLRKNAPQEELVEAIRKLVG